MRRFLLSTFYFLLSRKRGQSLVEILVAIGVGAILITAATTIIAPSLKTNTQANKVQIGTGLAKELVENVRVWAEGDWHNISNLSTSSANHYYLNTSSSPFTVISGNQSIAISTTTYTRYFYVDDVYRDSSDLIVTSTSFYDPSTKKVSFGYSWPNSTTSTITEYITRSRNNIFWQAGSGWWNSSWQNRRKITFNNSASASNLVNFPVLVALNSSNIDYTKTQNSGQDIRFVDADGTTALNYEIEKWDESATSNVWVKVPQIDAGSTTDYIWMYYNNTSATDNQSATSVWDSNFKGVWHLKEDPTGSVPQMKDSTSNANHGTSNGAQVSGDQQAAMVDGGLSFDGTDDYVDAGTGASITDMRVHTVSAWIKLNSFGEANLGRIVDKRRNFINGWSFLVDNGDMTNGLGFNQEFTNYGRWGVANVISIGPWYHVAVVYDSNSASNIPTFYVDGISYAITNTFDVPSGSYVSDASSSLRIGSMDDTLRLFDGLIDEVRVSDVARSTDWIKAEYKTESNQMNTFTSEESGPSGGGSTSSTLTSTIFDTGVNLGAQINSVLWHGSQPVGTTVRFQFAVSNSSSGPWSYIGSDGTSNTYYTVGPAVSSILSYTSYNNKRYFRYRVFLEPDNSNTLSPRVDDIIVNWSP